MPVGPYKTFGDCVVAQRRKGHSADAARRICGEIEKRTTDTKAMLRRDLTAEELVQIEERAEEHVYGYR